MRISNSFSEGEVALLDYVLRALVDGDLPAIATRHKDFPSLYRKVYAMKKQLEQKQREDQNGKHSV